MAASPPFAEFLALSRKSGVTKADLRSAMGRITDPADKAVAEKHLRNWKPPSKAASKDKSGEKAAKDKYGGLIVEIDRLNVALSKNNAAFASNTKAQSATFNQLVKYSLRVVELGYDISQVNDEYNRLSTNLASRVRKGFKQSHMDLTDQTLIWRRLGVGITDTTDVINTFDTTMGMTRREISTTGRTMTNFAVKTGQDVARVFKDMASGAGEFFDILDNAEATRQALTFQRRARSMGMSMQGLMGTLKKFEDIGSAQEAGAQLNAVLTSLGGSFDAVKASSMDYPERMDYLARSIQKVAPRIRSATPRVQRAYMSAFKAANFDASTIRKFMNFKPGSMAGGQGAFGGMGVGQERMLARRMTTIPQAFGAAQKLLPGKGGGMALMGAAGIPQSQMVALLKEAGQATGQGVVSLVTKAVEDSSEAISSALSEKLEGSDFKKSLDKLGGILGGTLNKLHTINDQQTAAIVANSHRKWYQ